MANRRRGTVKPARTVPDIDAKTGCSRIDPDTGKSKTKPAPGTTWWFTVDVGAGSNRKQVKRRGFPTKGAAQEALNIELERLRTNRRVDFSRTSLGDYLMTKWLPSLLLLVTNRRLELSTYTRYASDVRLHVMPHAIADTPLQKVDGDDLERHWALLATKTVKGMGKKPLSPRSVESVAVTLRKAFSDAVDDGQRLDNPTRGHMPGKPYRQAPRSWTADTIREFLTWNKCHDPLARSDTLSTRKPPLVGWAGDRLWPLWTLFAFTGARRGELLALDWDRDVHIDPGTCTCRPRNDTAHLKVNHAIRMIRRGELNPGDGGVTAEDLRRGWQWAEPKTDAGFRMISLDPHTVDALRESRARQKAERLALGSGWQQPIGPDGKPANLVFTDVVGRVLLPKIVTDIFARRTARFGHPLNLHGLRHSWATVALENGVHPKVVQKRLGHTRIQTTLDVYSHVRPAIDMEAAETVADAINMMPAPAPKPKPPARRRKAAGDNVTSLAKRRAQDSA